MRFKNKRASTVLVGALTVAGLALAAETVSAAEGFALRRVAGEDRYETAAALAADAFAEGSDVAIVASGESFPDALAGSFLAGRFGEGAPILLTQRDSLPESTTAALDELQASTVYVLGGTAAVSDEVIASLGAADRTVERIAGDDRYETAAAIASYEATGAADPGTVGGAKTVIVASGEGFADALAAGPLAFVGTLPIVLTPADALDGSAAAAIESVGAKRAWIVGGTGAIEDAVEDELEEMGLTAVRVAGANRYATAVAAAARGRADLGLTATAIDLASGENFPDALAAGPVSGAANRPLLLTARAALSDATEQYLVDNSAKLTEGRVFGGTAAVTPLAVAQANEAGSSGESLGVDRIVAIRPEENEYDYVTEGTDEIVTVTYEATDGFTVDGRRASEAAFEEAATPGDIIVVDADGGDPDDHDLTDVSAASFTSGTVGNVDLADDQLDIVEPVSGATLRQNIGYAEAFRVDGATATLEEFEADVNEGDTIEIAAGSFNLANQVVEGDADDTEVIEGALIAPLTSNETRFKIGGLGDDPAASSDPGQTPDEEASGNDDRYVVDGTDENLRIDGAEATYEQFEAAINDGDQMTYARQDGIETITIVNENEVLAGESLEGADGDGDGNPIADDSDGGSFTLVEDDGTETVIDYTNATDFIIDGVLDTEAAFEEELSAGDDVVVERDGSTIVSITMRNDAP